MTEANVVQLHDPIAHARATKARLWNPPNARQSSELDIASGSDLRRRRQLELKQREQAKRAEDDFRRAVAVDDLMRQALAEHIQLKQIAHKILVEDDTHPPKIHQIINAVAKVYGVTAIDVMSQRRTADVVRPRQVAMYLAKRITFKSLPEIGRKFGNRDHTTVLHAIRKIEGLIERDRTLESTINGLLEQLAEKA
jgi:chromosomal replication initiation ATPase DnaA